MCFHIKDRKAESREQKYRVSRKIIFAERKFRGVVVIAVVNMNSEEKEKYVDKRRMEEYINCNRLPNSNYLRLTVNAFDKFYTFVDVFYLFNFLELEYLCKSFSCTRGILFSIIHNTIITITSSNKLKIIKVKGVFTGNQAVKS